MTVPREIGVEECYVFGPFRADPQLGQLLRDGQLVPLPPKVFETLIFFLENSGKDADARDADAAPLA